MLKGTSMIDSNAASFRLLDGLCQDWNCKRSGVVKHALQKLEQVESDAAPQVPQTALLIQQVKTVLREAKKQGDAGTQDLKRLRLAYYRLRYRLGDPAERFSCMHEDPALVNRLSEAFLNFKMKDSNYPNQNLDDIDLAQIKALSCYAKIVNLILKNQDLQISFFKSYFRDNLGLEELCCYNIERLYPYRIQYHFGAFSSRKVLQVINENGKRFLGVLCEGRFINAFDFNQTIYFQDGCRITWRQLLKEFSKGDQRPTEFAFFYDGIKHWNSLRRGPETGNPDRYLKRLYRSRTQKILHRFKKIWIKPARQYASIALEGKEFWKKLPCLDILSKKAFENRYKITVEPTEKWFELIEAARARPTLDALNSHSYITLVERLSEDAFKIYPLGVFSEEWPRNLFSKLAFLGGTYKGTVAFPDPNFFSSFRQKAAHLSQEAGASFENKWERIAALQKSGIAFQFIWENCTSLIEAVSPGFSLEHFTCHFQDSHFSGLIKTVQSIWKRANQFFKKCFESVMHVLCMTKRSYLNKSLYQTPFKEKLLIRVPAKLHEQIRNGAVSGTITYGHPRALSRT